MRTFEYVPKGPFNLQNQRQYFQQCTTVFCEGKQTILTFAVDDLPQAYATAVLTQPRENLLEMEVHADPGVEEKAFAQVLAIFSLDVDGSGWVNVGERDAVIGRLQQKYGYVRPALFYSPYEAAVSFVIGNRISIAQRQQIMDVIARQYGHETVINGQSYFAFPAPQVLSEIEHLPGMNPVKMKRLKTIAQAALQGWLSREYLLSMPVEMALQRLLNLEGIGDFYASAILFRGAGIVHTSTRDDVSQYAMEQAYGITASSPQAAIDRITHHWDPYQMWCSVLLNIWLRHEVGLPAKRTFMPKKKKLLT